MEVDHVIKVTLTNEILKKISEIDEKRFSLSTIEMPPVIKNRLRKNSKKKSSYASNKIEGNPLTEKQANEAIDSDPHKHFLKPEQEVRNYFLALNFLEEKLKKKESKKLSGSSNSFEDMIAYVDENGMITSTPPTEDIKKEEINPDEIIIATPKKEEEEPTILRGRVEFFNESRGFGFIKDLSGVEKYFFHVNNVIGNIAENNIVTFDLERGVKGMNAINISLENKSTSEDLAQSKPV